MPDFGCACDQCGDVTIFLLLDFPTAVRQRDSRTITGITMQTMKFNHLSFPSRDVAATAAFFERHLEWQSTAMGRSRVLKGYGFDVVIEDATDRPVDWPGNFHIGFELPSLESLRQLYTRFQEAGVELTTALISHDRGSRFFCRIPGGVLVELNTREDAAPQFRASFGLT